MGVMMPERIATTNLMQYNVGISIGVCTVKNSKIL